MKNEPSRGTDRQEQKSGFEFQKLSAPAAALLTVLSASNAVAQQRDLLEPPQVVGEQNAQERIIGGITGKFLDELKRRGGPEHLEGMVKEDGTVTGTEELKKRLEELGRNIGEEIQERLREREQPQPEDVGPDTPGRA